MVEAQDTWEVPLNQEKTVAEFFVEEGQTVEVGTPLLRYDTTKAEADLAQAKTDLEGIKNEKTKLTGQIEKLRRRKRKKQERKNSFPIR